MSTVVSRRGLLLGASVAIAARYRRATAQETVNECYRDFASGDIPDLQLLGTNPALLAETKLADDILGKSPAATTALAVFLYLEAVKEVNKDREAYTGGWRDRWNPLIVRFFEGATTKPSGDTTPWCAASLNWALGRAGSRTTASASSGSFRNSPGATATPTEGDIVVFSRVDAAEAAVGRGHVGLFLDRSDGQILVLGGNQKNDFGHHAICRKLLSTNGRLLQLHSFHAAESFRKAL